MARASAVSSRDHKTSVNEDDKDEELEEFEQLLELERSGKVKLNVLDRMRLGVFKIIQKVVFLVSRFYHLICVSFIVNMFLLF